MFLPGENAAAHGLTGRETYDVVGLDDGLAPRAQVNVIVRGEEGERQLQAVARLDGPIDVDYYRQGGILPAVLRRLAAD